MSVNQSPRRIQNIFLDLDNAKAFPVSTFELLNLLYHI